MITMEKLQMLSQSDFAALGMNDIAFVKPVLVEGEKAYGIHAADGTPMAVVNGYDLAFAAIRQHDLEPVSVH
jgi:hypothetical protein